MELNRNLDNSLQARLLSGECILLNSVLSQQRFEVTDIKALGASQLSGLGQTVLQVLGKSVLQLYFI